ncbi:hypothetical protein [Oligoflexus tunisiensis]|uniref:GspE/PulE/PilB domain-containing protein n=1 Tax=Oligoflexus tunisiensis TaxID=708132 RepID=UPI00159F3258|nr:hypothetical protein [Oligoflexus tunisiensis]
MGASGLGALLVKEGFLTEQDRVTITKTCGQGSWAFAKCILATGLLDEDELSAFFAERTRYVVAPKNLLDRLDPGIIEQVDRRMVSRLEVLPLEIDHHRITVAVADPLDKSTLKQLEFFTGLEVVPVIAPLSQIHEGLNRLNPDFKARPTALSNFLRNHAGAAWIKQKIVEEGGIDIPHDRQPARAGAMDNYLEDQIEDVSLDDEIDAMDDTEDNLNDIDAGSLDEGIGNSDFDDIDLEDSGSDLELAPGDDPDHPDDAGETIDDAGLDVDDPFDNFDDAPKAGKVASAVGGDASDDLWPDEDEPAAEAATDELSGGDDFELDDVLAKPAKKSAPPRDDPSDDMDFGDEPALGEDVSDADAPEALSASDDLSDFGLEDDAPRKAKAAAADDLLDETPDLSLDIEDTPEKSAEDDSDLDHLSFGDAADENDDLASPLDEPAPKPAPAGKARMPIESTRMAQKPHITPPSVDDEDDLAGVEFADDDETSVSLRRAVHEDGVLPEFSDPNFDDVVEDTRIDLHAPMDDDGEFGEDTEETNIRLHAADAEGEAPKEPRFEAADEDGLEDLAMGFNDDDGIDEPAVPAPGNEPGLDDLAMEAELDDIPIEAPAAPVRAGGRMATVPIENGSVASLTATAKANEALLRMSLCFDRSTALEIAREYLPQISGTGCLVDIGKTTEALATWRSGAEANGKGKTAAFQRLAKAAKSGQWSQIPVSAQDEIFGSVKALSVYKIQKDDGRVLLLAGDYPVEDDSLREALTSFAEQLGAK